MYIKVVVLVCVVLLGTLHAEAARKNKAKTPTFQTLDKDSSGGLSQEEFGEAIPNKKKQEDAEKHEKDVKKQFKKADADKSRAIEEGEYAKFLSDQKSGKSKKSSSVSSNESDKPSSSSATAAPEKKGPSKAELAKQQKEKEEQEAKLLREKQLAQLKAAGVFYYDIRLKTTNGEMVGRLNEKNADNDISLEMYPGISIWVKSADIEAIEEVSLQDEVNTAAQKELGLK